MIDERRVAEAPGLRKLFHEQWSHLVRLIEEWGSEGADARATDDALLQAVEYVVDGTNSRMRGLGSYKRRLRENVRLLLEYTGQQVNALPGALEIDQKSFAVNPMVNALFVNRDEIRHLFSRSGEMQGFFSAAETAAVDKAYAILAVNRKQKDVFGRSLENGMLLGDVRQQSLSFSGHRVFSPCVSEEQARNSLKEMLFSAIVEYVKSYMTCLTYEQARDGVQSHPINNLRNPELYLERLTDLLSAPQQLLRMERHIFRVNKMGIMSSAVDEAVNEFPLHELKIGSSPPRAFALVKYPRVEMLPVDALGQ